MSAREQDQTLTNCNASLPDTSSSEDSMGRVDIAEVTDFGDFRSAVLSACKHQILRPYLRLIAVMGLRSFASDGARVWAALGHLQLALATGFTLFGYVIQYLTCFRRDRPLSCDAEDPHFFQNQFFGFFLPSVLHFLGYAYTMYIFRCKETERLENLTEKTFLLSAHGANGRKSHLVKRLWMFIYVGLAWVVVSLCSVSFFVSRRDANISLWVHSDLLKTALKPILVLSLLWQDMIQATVIASYCLQIQLLSSSLYFLRENLIQHTIQPLSWIREVNECQNVLAYLNRDYSPGVCVFILLDTTWIVSSAIRFFKPEHLNERAGIGVAIGLWAVAVLAPFALAAKLTSACKNLRQSGHEVRIRPFVYQDTPGEDLDTILLYTSTLKMKSKLFSLSITGPCLWLFFTLVAISVLVAGQLGLF